MLSMNQPLIFVLYADELHPMIDYQLI